LTFEEPDEGRFPCLALAKRAAAMGGTAPAVMNAVNEWAVARFLQDTIKFYDIPAIISQALDSYTVQPLTRAEDVWAAEKWAEEFLCQR
jgi:1-deoxy-D-xylulose-5-phosphate reductoisomerase